ARYSQSQTQVQNLLPIQSNTSEIVISKWFLNPVKFYRESTIRVLAGPEWDWLTEGSKNDILSKAYSITNQSNRMGYQLHGHVLAKSRHEELMSSGVLPGTIQLLPNGQPLVLMADCQTTGGYPRILQVIKADLPKLAQMGSGDEVCFQKVEMEEAIELGKQIDVYTSMININSSFFY
ncbi:MAG: biotin-dependent carboxyltransferase family protein, partial [Chitinophagaceae bacterium]|nr:biotin-dependent carboxyltransferase family protein [Chitinophagaceae bacterium]